MKKFLVVLVLFLSLGLSAQTKGVKTTISKSDLPVGKPFAIIVEGDNIFRTGVITKDFINKLPKGVPFVINVDGKVGAYVLKPTPKRTRRVYRRRR